MKETNHRNRKKTLILIAFLSISIIGIAQTQKGEDIDGEAANDFSGYSVSMPDANTIAIGANGNDGKGTDAGHVRIYTWNGNAWIQKGTDINGEAAGDFAGYSVSMPDARTVAIGARRNGGVGHVRIFSWNDSAWMQKGKDIDGEAAFDNFGYSVSMPDSNTIAVGANLNDSKGSDAGHVRIYYWNDSTWIQKGADIEGETSFDQSGFSVCMPTAHTVAIGSPGNNSETGHTRIYTWNGNAWVQKGSSINGESGGDFSGTSVSMPDSNTIAIGARGNDGTGAESGHTRVYTWNGTIWSQKGADIDGEAAADYSGISVSMPDINTLAIGAIFNAGKSNSTDINKAPGHTRIYKWNGSSWIKKGADIDGEAAGDYSGYSVCMPDAITLAIGAYRNDGKGTNAGHVRIYDICKNNFDTISPTACNTYLSPSKKYIYNKSGTYYDTMLNSTGCDSIVTINLILNITDISVTNNSPTVISNATGALYQWLDCNNGFSEISGANKQSYTATTNGSYAVKVTQDGCTDTSLCINISNVNTLKNSFASNLKAYPNPTPGDMNIELGAHYNDVTVIARNQVGQQVLVKLFSNTKLLQFHIPSEAGFYTVEVTTNDKKALLKVLKT